MSINLDEVVALGATVQAGVPAGARIKHVRIQSAQ